MSKAGKYIFRAANVWRRCAQYFVIALVARCPETIDVCIWRIFVFMSVVVIVWGSVCCVATVVEDSSFMPWSVEVCLCRGCD